MKSVKITLVTLGLLVLSVAASYAQIKIGTNPTTINTNSLLEVESDKKGILLPRLELKSAILADPLTAHVAGMIVYNTVSAGTAPNNVVPGFYYNDGAKWLNLADLSVTTGKIDNLAVTNGKLAADAVTTDKILDGTILAADIASGGNNKVLVTDATGAVAWVDKTGFGAIADLTTIEGLGTTASPFKVKNSGITAIKLATDAVETAKIKNDAVTTDKILNANVTTAKIADANITTAKIASGANNTVLVTDATGAVTWLAKDGFGAVADQTTIVGEGTTASKFSVKNGGITTVKLATDAVETAKIKNDAVETSKIKNEAVTPAKIEKGANNTVLVTDATGAVTWLAKDGFGAVADQTTIVGEGTTASKFSVKDGGITTTQILDGTVATIDLADNAVTTGKIANGTIKNEDLNKTDIPLSGFAAAAASVDLGSQNLINVKDPIAAQDAATKKYVDDATAAINTLADGNIYIGNASNVATEVTMSGDVTISNAGVTTIGASKVLTGMIADGTIITADLADNAVETAKIKDAAVTTAKILDANVTPAKIAPGTANQILVTNSASPLAAEWFTPTNTLTATNGQLVSTVNGLASTPAVNVLISANNGLTATNGNVQLGGALTAATKITTDATKTLALEGLQAGANTDKMLVVNSDGVIKSVSASARNVLGIVKETANYTVVDGDHTILADVSGGAFTITLPTASSSTGRVLLIRKIDETNNVLEFSQSIKYSETTSFTTLNYLSTIRIQSDGTAWYKID